MGDCLEFQHQWSMILEHGESPRAFNFNNNLKRKIYGD
nr:MAG TPA: hypothetical protein [Caudoviricetes sp.]